MAIPDIYLVDNGSLRPSATIALRDLAKSLSLLTDHVVEPVSLLHSHKIDPVELGGQPATILKRRLRAALASGKRDFILLPLFLGPSRAITDYIPEVLDSVQPKGEPLHVVVADPICGASFQEPDKRLAEMLADQVRTLCPEAISEGKQTAVALVDHGTPAPEVNQLRNAVARDLKALLGELMSGVIAASMERRDGPEYAFNEPLLEDLNVANHGLSEDLVIAMFFLLPGRHAGDQGDVAEICQGLLNKDAFSRIRMTGLLGEHPALLEILADRLRDACLLADRTNREDGSAKL